MFHLPGKFPLHVFFHKLQQIQLLHYYTIRLTVVFLSSNHIIAFRCCFSAYNVENIHLRAENQQRLLSNLQVKICRYNNTYTSLLLLKIMEK